MINSSKSLKFRLFINFFLLINLGVGIVGGISINLLQMSTNHHKVNEFTLLTKMIESQIDGDFHASLEGAKDDLQKLFGLQKSLLKTLNEFPEILTVSTIRVQGNNLRNVLELKSGSELVFNLNPVFDEDEKNILNVFSGTSQIQILENFDSERNEDLTSGYSKIFRSDGSLEAVIKVEFDSSEFVNLERKNLSYLLIAFFVLFLSSIGVCLVLSSNISRTLINFSSDIVKDNFLENEIIYSGKLPNELIVVQDAVNNLVERYKKSLVDIEDNFNYRYRELEIKIGYLEKTTLLSQAAVSELDFNKVLQKIVELIQEHFSFYFVGLYLCDASNQVASLKAGTGRVGLQLMHRRKSVSIGQGLIGEAITSGQARVTLEFGKNYSNGSTSELPLTRSEAVLPLMVRGLTIGAISIHSERTGEFNKVFLDILQILANYVAIAIENARLFAEMNHELETSRYSKNELATQKFEGEKKEYAEQEKIISNISSRIRSTTNANTILRTALIELAEVLKVPRVSVHLKRINEKLNDLPEDENGD